MIRRWAMTGLGSGYSPIASGTAGSAVAIVFAFAIWWIQSAVGAPAMCMHHTLIVLTVLASVGCIVWGPWAVEYFSAKAKKPGDPGQVVLDEFAGQWLALLAIPMPTLERTLAVMAVQFFLFRLFDVIKPWPASKFEKLPNGWGILTDDLAAAIYANIIGQIIFRWVMG